MVQGRIAIGQPNMKAHEDCRRDRRPAVGSWSADATRTKARRSTRGAPSSRPRAADPPRSHRTGVWGTLHRRRQPRDGDATALGRCSRRTSASDPPSAYAQPDGPLAEAISGMSAVSASLIAASNYEPKLIRTARRTLVGVARGGWGRSTWLRHVSVRTCLRCPLTDPASRAMAVGPCRADMPSADSMSWSGAQRLTISDLDRSLHGSRPMLRRGEGRASPRGA